jgi:peptide methionine sulfoxide reductase MsrA
MFKFLNIFANSSSTLLEKSGTRSICILRERYKSFSIDVYNNFNDPLFKLDQVQKVLQQPITKGPTRLLNNDEMIDLLFTSSSKEAPEFLKWSRSIIQKFNQNSSQHITYDEIEKPGHVYVLETDGGIKVGKTKDPVKKRVKNLQTGNVNDIKILFDYQTCNQDLLEKYVHYILQRYRCNSNREFFDCNVEYIINVIRIAGNVLDTLKSSFENISNDEIFEKMSSKLSEIHPINLSTNNTIEEPIDTIEEPIEIIIETPSECYTEETGSGSSSMESELSNSSLFAFLSENVEYKRGSFLDLSKLCQEYYGKRVSPRTMTRKVPIIEYYIKENVPKADTTIQKIGMEKGWKHLRIIPT